MGKVVRKLTSDTEVDGFRVTASDEDPRYLVRSEKTSAEAAHKPDARRRL
jgi:Hypervirulence associated proteins TUDOR domain